MSRLDRRDIVRARKVVIRADTVTLILGRIKPGESVILTGCDHDDYFTVEFEMRKEFTDETVPSIDDLLSFE